MTIAQFSPQEQKALLNAPHWVLTALIAAERGTILTRRNEAKALEKFLAGYTTQSLLVKDIIARQSEADDKLEGSVEDAEKALGQVGALLEQKAGPDDGEAVRDFLMKAGQAVAKATREALIGDTESAQETKALARIQAALKATDADKKRRQEAAQAAEAERRDQGVKAAAERQRAEAGRAEAAKKAAEAEAKKKAEEAEAKRKAEEAQAKLRAAQAEAARSMQEAEAKRRAQEAEAARAEAARKNAEAEAASKAAETEAAKKAAEAEAAAKAAQEAQKIYVVKKGDTLSGIALQVYGKAARWPEIYEANKDIIKRPNLIRPGWKLRIP